MSDPQVSSHLGRPLTVVAAGKARRLSRLSDPNGRFAMLAVDQRTSLERMLNDVSDSGPEADAIQLVKRVVTAAVAPMATAILTDPEYGYPHTLDVLPRQVGLILAVEVSGYQEVNSLERRTRLLDGFGVEDAVRIGADAVKLLLYHNPGVSDATAAHQDDIVLRVGQACAQAEVPFILEIVTYGLGVRRSSEEFIRQKPDLVLGGVRRYSDPRFQVDLFKVQFPADLKYTEEFQDRPFARGKAFFDDKRVSELCWELDEAANAPWVLLSAGVEPEEFVLNIGYANDAGSSGFLCGRAVWKDVVGLLPDEEAMRRLMSSKGRRRFDQMRSANVGARPWFMHRRFTDVPLGRSSDTSRGSGTAQSRRATRRGNPRDHNGRQRPERLPIGKTVRYLLEHCHGERCLLAVCPNSEAVAKAAMEAAMQADAPLIYTATLNQIDSDGGYTGWTPAAFSEFAAAYAREIGYDRPIGLCLDHGGPWLKDKHTTDGLTLEESMAQVKASLEACIDAGYSLLHIDPTVDRTLPDDAPIPIELVIERTLELMTHAEEYRRRRGAPVVSYEVGTEEVHGGLADLDTFDAFLKGLDEGLRAQGLENAWPCFVVGKVGTDLHTDFFQPDVARTLTERVVPFGALIKGHYTDDVSNPEDYPLSGMGGANVGPEFTEAEYKALTDLTELEKKIGRDSGLEEVLREAVIATGRWKKWLHEAETGVEFDELASDRQDWLLRTCSRYIWKDPDVEAARQRLYANVRPARNGDAYVRWQIRTAVMKYYHAFNLIDFNQHLSVR